MDDREDVRRELSQAFRRDGFVVKRDALNMCTEMLHSKDKTQRGKWITKIIETVRKQPLPTASVSAEVLTDVIRQISNCAGNEKVNLLNVYDAFQVPRFELDADCRRMLRSTRKLSIFSPVSNLTEAFRQRYKMIHLRLQRSGVLTSLDVPLSTVEALRATHRRIDKVVVLGLLSQQKADCYHVEDLTGSVQVEFLADTKFGQGIFTEGAIFLVLGSYDAGLLSVKEVQLVPAEHPDVTRGALGNENWFGGEDKTAFRANAKLRVAERNDPNAFIVFLSEVHLDSPNVMQALYHLLNGYATASVQPVAFVFCGNFCSKPRQPITNELLHQGFRRLSEQINEVKESYAKTDFIFVPGPDDPSLNMMLPRPYLPASLFELMKNGTNCIFMSNPARIQYASQEIVILRDDLVEKMCRNAINATEKSNIPSHFAKTILSQGHLSPLPMHVTPVLWDYDQGLSMPALPDLLVIADKFKLFIEPAADAGTQVVNPGIFSRGSPFNFFVYYPQTRLVEQSAVEI